MVGRWCAAILASALFVGPASGETFGLVIGIDDYAFVSDLAGAVNDANDIAQSLREQGAQVTALLDSDATRARIESAFADIVAKSQPGDTIVFTYAGHGIQQREALAGDERDGRDEMYILHGFHPKGDGWKEIIRDNDIAAMLRTVPHEVTVLMVADSCHSGTMTRSADPRGRIGRSRFQATPPMEPGAPAPAPDPSTRALEMDDFPNVVFAAAARDFQETPEVFIEGQHRGALSYSVARAFNGMAAGGDGVTTLKEFQSFVIEQVRAFSEARQTPGVEFARTLRIEEEAGDRPELRALFGSTAEAETPAPAAAGPEQTLALAEAPLLFIRGEAESTRAILTAGGVPLAASEDEARMLWDRPSGQLVDLVTADVVAEVPGPSEVDAAILKWRAVQPLIAWAPRRPLSFRLEPDDGLHSLGEDIYITVTRPDQGFDYLTIVNLASTGEVQFVYPSPGHTARNLDRIPDRQKNVRLGPAPVTEPVGADHVIAIASRERLSLLHSRLDRLNGKPAPEEFLALLEEFASDPAVTRVGLLPIFTQR